MKTRRILIIMVVSVFIFSFIPASYAATNETGDGSGLHTLSISNGSEGDGDEDVDESSILPPSDEEYLISSTSEAIFGPGKEGISTRTIRSRYVVFKKTSEKKAKFSISLQSSRNITKLYVKAELLKKVGSTYKSTGKSASLAKSGYHMTGEAVFAVAKSSNYKIKVTITEYEGNTKHIKAPVFYKLNRNNY